MPQHLSNFVKFAESGIPPAGISTEAFILQIKDIESEIGHKLVREIQQDLFITDFGREFYNYAKKSLQIIQEGICVSSESNFYDFENQITLGIARDSASTWALNCIRSFNKMHPGLRLTILTDDTLTEEIVEKSTIIFWCHDQDLTKHNKSWFIEYKYGLYASDTYLDKYGIPTIDTIKDHKIIAYSGDENYEISNWHLLGNKYGLPQLTPSVFAQSRALIVKMIANGTGIGTVSDHQDAYYGYKHLKQVVKVVEGPVLKSYFFIREGLSEQALCNAALLSKLFQNYFINNNIAVLNC